MTEREPEDTEDALDWHEEMARRSDERQAEQETRERMREEA